MRSGLSCCRFSVSTCAGFTLVEVLVALFVAALGIAGAAGIQAVALRSAREAARLADGVRLAAALAERMQANPAAMALADNLNPYLQLDQEAGAALPAAASCYGADAACSPDQLARFDLMESAQALAARFPGGRVLACRDAAQPDPASGLLPWSCAGQPGAPVAIKLGWSERAGEAAVPRVLLVVAGGAS